MEKNISRLLYRIITKTKNIIPITSNNGDMYYCPICFTNLSFIEVNKSNLYIKYKLEGNSKKMIHHINEMMNHKKGCLVLWIRKLKEELEK